MASAGHGRFLLCGVIFGLQTLNRPNVLVAVVGMIAVLVLLRRARTAALVLAGVLVALAPVLIRNAIVSRQFALSSSQGGLNFFIGNNAAATGQYVAVPGVRGNIEGQAEDTRKVAEAAAGRALSDAEVSAHFTGLASSWIRSNPGAAARLFVKKLALVFNARHQWLDFSYPYYAYDAGTSLWLLFVGPWLLVPLGLVGLSWTRSAFAARRLGGTREIRDGSYLAWASFVPLYVDWRGDLLCRRALPAAVVRGALRERRRRARLDHASLPATDPAHARVAAAAVVFLAASIVALWPFRLDDGRFEERLRLSKVLMNRGDYGLAAMELERAHALDPSHTIAEFNLGMALVSSGRAAEGIVHARRAVDAGVAMPGARYALAGALMATGDRERSGSGAESGGSGAGRQRRELLPRRAPGARCGCARRRGAVRASGAGAQTRLARRRFARIRQ